MTDLATALAHVEELADVAEDESLNYEKGSAARYRQLERFRNLSVLADAETLEGWLADAAFQARWIADDEQQEPEYFARLILDLCPPERVAELASWEARRPWFIYNGNRMWNGKEAATVRRAMSEAMVLDAHLLKPEAPERNARSR
jgi:hypothetical protein